MPESFFYKMEKEQIKKRLKKDYGTDFTTLEIITL